MTDARPDPAVLLARVRREQSRAGRGRLKIFFGMAPGVGKTYAMLTAGHRLAAEGVDVVVAIVETHGRTETEQLLLGIDLLPRREVDYRGTTLSELDLDAAIARKPEVLLVDELAHTNAPGGRFEKRWQDVQEILRAGINVYTTLNVQHLESLNDVIAQITGVKVRETVPDSVVDEADEIELVDLPPDALLERLKAGKVYVPESARVAVDSFFRKGNLTALRELALRRTASWVDAQMRLEKEGQGARTVWPTTDRVLVCVSPSPSAADLVRAAKRIAAGLRAELIAVFVDTPATTGLAPADRDRVLQTLRVAESLGAETVMLSASAGRREAAIAVVQYARSRNVSKIVLGKTAQSRFRQMVSGSFMDELIRESGEIEVHVLRGDSGAGDTTAAETEAPRPGRVRSSPIKYAMAFTAVLLTSGLCSFVLQDVDLANIAMLYLATVVLAAVWLGRGPAVLAAVFGVAAFDFFFVPPRFTFAVADVQYVVTFAVMLAVGLLIANLTTRLSAIAEVARQREGRTSTLYAMTRELTASRDAAEVAAVAVSHVHDTFVCDAAVLVPVDAEHTSGMDVLAFAGSPDWLDDRERSVARWTFEHIKQAGSGTRTLSSSVGRFVPLAGSQGKIAVLALRPSEPRSFLTTEQLLLLDTFANQITLALERVKLIEDRQQSTIDMESERMRSALLSSVSHDLRTPLASIAGSASTLRESHDVLDATTRIELIDGIVAEATRLNDLIGNLVFATRLEAGTVELRREWTTVDEIVGVGLARLRHELGRRNFTVRVPNSLPFVRVDTAMLPQVIHNLVENAVRHTTEGTPIRITAWVANASVVVSVADEGEGLATDDASRVFQRFYRGRTLPAGGRAPTATHAGVAMGTGLGLGLTICDGIVRAHGGRIWTEPHLPRGVSFLFSLPIENPQPSMPVETST